MLTETECFWRRNRDEADATLAAVRSPVIVDEVRPRFARQPSFWVEDLEFVRWVPVHPFLPYCPGQVNRLLLEGSMPDGTMCGFVEEPLFYRGQTIQYKQTLQQQQPLCFCEDSLETALGATRWKLFPAPS